MLAIMGMRALALVRIAAKISYIGISLRGIEDIGAKQLTMVLIMSGTTVLLATTTAILSVSMPMVTGFVIPSMRFLAARA